MVAVTGPVVEWIGIVQGRQTLRQPLVPAMTQRRIAKTRVGIEQADGRQHQLAADAFGAGIDLRQGLGHPVGGHDRIGIGRRDDAIRLPKIAEAAQRFLHGKPPRPADMGMTWRQHNIDDVQGKFGVPGSKAMGDLGRPVGTVVHHQDDFEQIGIEGITPPVHLGLQAAKAVREKFFLVMDRNGHAHPQPPRGRTIERSAAEL